MGKRIGFAELVFFILIVGAPTHANGGRAVADSEQKVDAVRFTILSADGQEVIGSSEYRSEHLHDRTLLVGENRYKDGEHDVERDELAFNKGNTVPVMVNFEHTFFNSDGSHKLFVRADPRSGSASCVSYEGGQKRELSKKLDFPSDTYAGAAAIVAIQTAFRDKREDMAFHAFDCAPEPALAAVVAERSGDHQHWASYPRPVAQVQLTAKFGWIGNLLGTLLPHRSAWFDPARGWQYVGGKIQRYLARGPQVMLIREEDALGAGASDRQRPEQSAIETP